MDQVLVNNAQPTSVIVARRTDALGQVAPASARQLVHLLRLAPDGLAASFDANSDTFAHTVRAVEGTDRIVLQREGTSLRYAAIAALGLTRLPRADQHVVCARLGAHEMAAMTARRAESSADPGAVALAVWAAAETGGYAVPLIARLRELIASNRPLPTVDVAWILTAAVKANRLGDTDDLVADAAALLSRHHGRAFPHVLPPTGASRWRAHVGSFADQIYPLQAFALASVLTGNATLLEYAEDLASNICEKQGTAGQWWWHYDARDGSVVERYPVYSVHQHAMAPMALFDLWESGGTDYRGAIARGVDWLGTHPETCDELVSERHGLVWRKVGRREPRKAARAAGALASSIRPGLRVPGLDRLLPPGPIDHECRPYELGWLLYAWLPAGAGDEE